MHVCHMLGASTWTVSSLVIAHLLTAVPIFQSLWLTALFCSGRCHSAVVWCYWLDL